MSSKILEGYQKMHLVDLICTGAWDFGAIRTVQACHKYDDPALEIPLDGLLLMFYLRYRTADGWACKNASACLVALELNGSLFRLV